MFALSSGMEMQSPLSSYSVGRFPKLILQPQKHSLRIDHGLTLQKALPCGHTGVGAIKLELCPFTEEEMELKVTRAMFVTQ